MVGLIFCGAGITRQWLKNDKIFMARLVSYSPKSRSSSSLWKKLRGSKAPLNFLMAMWLLTQWDVSKSKSEPALRHKTLPLEALPWSFALLSSWNGVRTTPKASVNHQAWLPRGPPCQPVTCPVLLHELRINYYFQIILLVYLCVCLAFVLFLFFVLQTRLVLTGTNYILINILRSFRCIVSFKTLQNIPEEIQ